MEPKLKEKQWSAEAEAAIAAGWEASGAHAFNPSSERPIFVIDTPPPYPSAPEGKGPWHIGAVAGYSLIDMIARSRRMMGYEVLFPFGLDRNGINIELLVERKYKKRLHQFDRAEFLRLCREELEKPSQGILALAKRIGFSADFKDHFYMTDSPEYRRKSQAAFIELFRRGLVYRGERPNFYCPGCGTTIAEADIEYQDRPSSLAYIRFPTKDGRNLVIATTRPELLPACRAIMVHPDDDRYRSYRGTRAIVPIFGQEVGIHPHPAAKPEFGTGAAMICSYGDTTDIQLFRELQLEPVKAIDEEGRMTGAAGKYQGKRVEEARAEILGDLQAQGLLLRREEVLHKTPVCERSKDPVEFIQTLDWYLKQLDVLDELRRVARGMEFHPDRSRQLLLNWIDSISIDWPIGRRRYYHTEIPLWYCKGCGAALAPDPGPYYQPWKDPPPFKTCPKCGAAEFQGEEGVFDTWMDSSISNLVACGFMVDEALLRKTFPPSLRPQGRDIVRNWLYYTTLKSYYLKGERPFHHVFIHGMGLDKLGRAMHKSLGNVIEPEPVLARHGADAFRFWAASETNPGEDFRISEEKIAGAKKFLSKLWNVSRFVSSFPNSRPPKKPAATDRWILGELNDLVEQALQGYAEMNPFIPSNRIREYLWNLFAPHYLEMVKVRAYQGDPSALATLHENLRAILRLLAPIAPFATDLIWREVYGGSVHAQGFPQAERAWRTDLTQLTPKLVEFNSTVWGRKKEQGLPLNAELSGVEVPEDLLPFKDDLARMHRLQGAVAA